jgi:gas vesicle protein
MGHRHSVTDEPLKLIGIAAIAAAVGATVAMLFTPRSGEQVRGGLKRRATVLKDDVRDKLVRTVDEVDEATEDTKERLRTAAANAADEAKTTARKAARTTKSTAARAKTTAKRAAKPRNTRS